MVPWRAAGRSKRRRANRHKLAARRAERACARRSADEPRELGWCVEQRSNASVLWVHEAVSLVAPAAPRAEAPRLLLVDPPGRRRRLGVVQASRAALAAHEKVSALRDCECRMNAVICLAALAEHVALRVN